MTEVASQTPEEVGDGLVECRQVPTDVCIAVATSMIEGPQPDYASEIEKVLVTCETLPPCGWDRGRSGGKVMILYTNGWAWSQDWTPLGGV